MSCHIGNAAEGKVVTHGMFAAGHPPLPPIEIAQFTKNQPQHWRDSRDVPLFRGNPPKEIQEIYHLKDLDFQGTKLALIGNIVALRETLRLVRDRADFKAMPPRWPELLHGRSPGANEAKNAPRLPEQIWPEIAMAHTDCYACHHDLRSPSYRQERGSGYRLSAEKLIACPPGRPLIRVWPTALALATTEYLESPEKSKRLHEVIESVVNACTQRRSVSRMNSQHPLRRQSTGAMT